jgi:hypothetical protein
MYLSLCNKKQRNAHFLHQCFDFLIVSSIRFEQLEDLYMQFYGISFMLKL